MFSDRSPVFSAESPDTGLPFSQAMKVGNFVFLSGVIGNCPNTGKVVSGGVEAEAHQALKNMGTVLSAAGIGYEHVVDCTVLLVDIADFAKVNAIYAQYFKKPYPARACFAVAALPMGARFEIKAVAATVSYAKI
ncbi:hypothetical protein L596_017924 [Steinernema carpocapsae]|uniref:Uncharacterized protein n=1 Tax=Steinernema carpocapsae TaxID=34508 RepID=A0A4U5N336_STECR|nr:hypothetical protein L596_017924 [Steinernema carpocapsae]